MGTGESPASWDACPAPNFWETALQRGYFFHSYIDNAKAAGIKCLSTIFEA